jgi:Trypsin
MKGSLGIGVLALACVAGCSGVASRAESIGVVSSAIQDGTADTTHDFVVGVVQLDNQAQSVEICSGALLAPNLVATARHCVSTLSSPQIICGSSTFGGTVDTNQLFVSSQPNLQSPVTSFTKVVTGGIIVPTGADHESVCGNDIAFLILQDNIQLGTSATDLSGYVVPSIDPPMTDPSYSTDVTAIGYGIDTPTDDAGLTAGVRRIKENVPIQCIPDDTHKPALNCFTGPNGPAAEQVMTSNEFVSGNASTCEGDSGSNAFDQAYFDEGDWVSFGVLSRGSVSADGQTCVQPIYSRFDAWSDLLISAANQAQAMASPKYALPSWAQGTTVTQLYPAAASSGAGTVTTGQQCEGSAALAAGTACVCDSECVSNQCVSADGTNYLCASPCNAGACSTGFMCLGSGDNSYCFPEAAPSGSKGQGGCSVSPSAPLQAGGPAAFGALFVLGLGACARRSARSSQRDGRTAARPGRCLLSDTKI